ncbi:MAG TPA: SIMPL domain-containing protein [Verrucomicrobiae bacterium]|nr:SIMPL domain-containing protein [Verrucomicrobiae bacterium]
MLAGLFLAAGLVFSAVLGTTAWVKIHNSQFISVKGSARKNIKSDLAIWSANFTTEAPTLLDAQRRLGEDRVKVEAFLNREEMTNHFFTAITIEELKSTYENVVTNGDGSWRVVSSQEKIAGYKLKQSVQARSENVERVEQLDGESTALVEQGVLLTAEPPRFIYTKSAEAKIEMLAEATGDARARAEQIASRGGRGLARLYSADMGIFQITSLNSSETSGEGINDTTSVEKTITAVVTASFALE